MVCGMHRSGTSMVAAMLRAGGVHLGADDEMVVRGGSWYQPAEECRSASRGRSNPKPTAGGGGDAHRIGFRVLCEVIYP